LKSAIGCLFGVPCVALLYGNVLSSSGVIYRKRLNQQNIIVSLISK
jgi:hypothetical protein